MDSSEMLREIVEETCGLVKQAAHPRRNTLKLSPELAGALESIRFHETPEDAAAAAGEVPENGEAAAELDYLAEEVSACEKCPLYKSRSQTVFGQGSASSRLVFVGEAPGAEEDRQGVPFVGAAGKLLTRIIERGMKLKRSEVYICNVLKCRPPGNRDPRADEVEQCEPYLMRQLELIRPKVICALGGHAAKTLLRTTESTGRLRGKWHFYRGIPLRVTYHPAYLLRTQDNPERYQTEKRKVWDDVQAVMRVLRGEDNPQQEASTGHLFD